MDNTIPTTAKQTPIKHNHIAIPAKERSSLRVWDRKYMSVKEKNVEKEDEVTDRAGEKCEPSCSINIWKCVTDFILSFLEIRQTGVSKHLWSLCKV